MWKNAIHVASAAAVGAMLCKWSQSTNRHVQQELKIEEDLDGE